MKIPISELVKNEKGAALVTALLVLVILTIMGTVAMTIRNTEQSIVLNSEVFQHNFYTMEGVTLEGAHILDNLDDKCLHDFINPANNFTDPSCTANPPNNIQWLKTEDTANAALDLTLEANWPSGSITPVVSTLNAAPTDFIPDGYNPATDRIQFAALDKGVCAVTSVTDPTKTEKCYDVYGMYDIKRGGGKTYTGRMILLVGYQQVVYASP